MAQQRSANAAGTPAQSRRALQSPVDRGATQQSANRSSPQTTSNVGAPVDLAAASSLTSGNEVFYIHKSQPDASSSGSSVCLYNTQTKATEDIIKMHSAASGYDPKAAVENIILDKHNNQLFFSTSTVNRRGYTQFVTWKYDIDAKSLMAYRDGKIESVDAAGNQTIVFEGSNANGNFTSRSVVAPDGKVIQSSTVNSRSSSTTTGEKNVN